MLTYTFWNNKGGTGKTSLAFQTICRYAEQNPKKKILAIDVCPQANFSELLLGGLEGQGSHNLLLRQGESKRASIGGYFQDRLPSPFSVQEIRLRDFITNPHFYNNYIPQNIDLICGDPLLELQVNAISTLANTQIPGTNTWITIIDWMQDLLNVASTMYDIVFFDTNPSFSIYTQMTLAATNRLMLPVMADDSSKRALQNAFSLIYGYTLPHPIYAEYAFSNKLKAGNRCLPKIHLILKNRLTQYMGAASAYSAVLGTIEDQIRILMNEGNQDENKNIFTFTELSNGFVDIRDFQTTGVVSYARGCPFFRLQQGSFSIQGKRVQIKADYLENCVKAIDEIVEKIAE